VKESVPKEIEATIVEKGTLGREAWKSGRISEAENYFLEGWNVLPEPRTNFDFAQSLSRGMVTFYRDTSQFEKAFKWLDVMRESYGPAPNDSVEFLAATVHFETGNRDEAFRIFDDQVKRFKFRPFQGKDPKYLNFYKSRSKSGR